MRKITSVQHELVKHIVRLRQNHDYRYEHQCLFIEGIKPVKEICRTFIPKRLFVWDESLVPNDVHADEIVLVNEHVMQKISGMQHPEGLAAEIPMPKSASLAGKKHLVVLDGVSDPGNVGNILRTALALGWEGAFILKDSCDPFNEKALRAARGATFRLPIAWGSWDQLLKLAQENQLNMILAELQGQSLRDLPMPDRIALVLGNEAHGASPRIKQMCQAVAIPMTDEMESLNVSAAGAIMMFVLKRMP